MRKYPDLKSDFALVCDTELFAPDLPTLCVGLRGLVYTEMEAVGAKTDLHSGVYGGAAPNPLLRSANDRQDEGRERPHPDPWLLRQSEEARRRRTRRLERLPFNEEEYRKTEVGSNVLTGEPGYSVLFRTWARPTLEVHGMPGGFVAPAPRP